MDFKVKELKFYGDCIPIIFHTMGEWKTLDPKLQPYRQDLENLVKHFQNITHMPQKKIANALVTLT